ncbi:hypothetical protein Tsubulata_021169 [Turnera subulata]|uniref:glycine--tRNA ligase n=1 Tax=Turnera subulata TaxID=218843 RepID=A0A9Q0GH08_9ROSI|nr:hypothetical protein Tsubulata_021169 [Turnera subulata]
MRRAGIEVEIEDCKNIILKHSTTLAKSVNGHVQIQESLLNEVVNIVEAPVPVLGKFKESFLELREDLLTMVMQKHLKYFSITGDNGRLLPYFIAEKLGTMLDQMTRVQNTVAKLSLELGINEDLLQTVDDVASLAMSDLAAAVVVEFASLSGIMARHCALRDGYSEQIAEALFKIMLPKFSGNRFPQTDVGILRVAWADMKFRFKGLVHLKPRTILLEVQTLCKF